MKKHLTLIIALLIIITALTLMVTACDRNSIDDSINGVKLTGARLTWDEVKGASEYFVNVMFSEVSGFEISVKDTKYILNHTVPGEYRYKVRALTPLGFTEYSDTFIYKLGDGSRENPITVGSKEELERISSGLRTIKNEDNENISVPIYYMQTNDIDLENEEWTPIGLGNNVFKGIYDGQGFNINNLKITKVSGTGSNVATGLFGLIQDATIKNVNIVEPYIRITQATTQFSVGALVGRSTTSIVKNCSVIGDITINAPITGENILYAALIIGESRGTGMHRLFASGEVKATYSRVYAGGIVGITKTSSADIIDNCVSYVDITSHGTGRTGETNKAVSYAGGIAGYLSYANKVENCYFTGNLKATAIDGTPITNIHTGMFGGAQNASLRCNIMLTNCYFNIEDFDLEYNETYPNASSIAEMYTVGNCTKLRLGSSAFGITSEVEGLEETYNFDFNNVWEIVEGKPMLQQMVLPTVAEMSEVSIEGNIISWEALAGASEYYVENITKVTKDTVYNLTYTISETDAGEYEFRVGAKVIGELTDYSDIVVYIIEE